MVAPHRQSPLGPAPTVGAERAVLSSQQRLRLYEVMLLARALAQDCGVWLFDEPTAHMDLGHRLHTFEWLRAWLAEQPQRRAALLITHDLQLAARFADCLTLLCEGRVLASGSPAQVLTRERIARAYGVDARVELSADGRVALEPLRFIGAGPIGRG